jgi:hypothetical protein
MDSSGSDSDDVQWVCVDCAGGNNLWRERCSVCRKQRAGRDERKELPPRRSPRFTEALPDKFSPLGLRPEPTAGGGNCLFNSVSKDPHVLRAKVHQPLLAHNASLLFDKFLCDGRDVASEAHYIQFDGHWGRSIHVAGAAVVMERSIVVVDVAGGAQLYGADAVWRCVTTMELLAMLHGANPPIVIGLEGRKLQRHFFATVPVLT